MSKRTASETAIDEALNAPSVPAEPAKQQLPAEGGHYTYNDRGELVPHVAPVTQE